LVAVSGHWATLASLPRHRGRSKALGLGLEIINHGTVCLLTPLTPEGEDAARSGTRSRLNGRWWMSRTDANSGGCLEVIPIRWGGGAGSPSGYDALRCKITVPIRV
jgi:hypothetical protein